jgi:quinoprotein glucose dehydrogenase
MLRLGTLLFALVLSLAAATPCKAVPGDETPPPSEATIAAASNEGEQAIGSFKVPETLKTELVAAEPLLANPVAFYVDPQGRIFVCETFRQGKGVEDNRGHDHWLNDDLAATTVEDRLAYIKKHLGEKANDYAKHDDRIRLLEDTDGDGKSDKATVFAERFNDIVDGTGAGVLFHQGNVYYTNIPHLWLLRDNDADGKAEVRKALHSGYGVRFAFRGHDMHGLVVGPDGRLYFSIGDRGLNVKTAEGKQLVNVESGSVLRCELDGSNLELFATGLRNPQELAFDDYGNLFTGDNNSDSGDKARWVYVVEGGDTGWRMAYQYLPDRGPFNREKIWHPQHAGQPAYIVPPIVNFASGPSGLAHYPGVGLPDHFKDRFFLCDFRGGPAGSGVRTFRVKPKGASFEMVNEEETLWNILATDVDFGPDGAVYVSDWVNGWNGEGKGRIYRFSDKLIADQPQVKELQQILKDGFENRSPEELTKLLAHADRRVRQGAQFALVEKQQVSLLTQIATTNESLLARLHAIWGLGQLARRGSAGSGVETLGELLRDKDPEVRAQSARILGERKDAANVEALIALLADDSSRVRFFAAEALGKIGSEKAIPGLLTAIAENGDSDATLRHGLVMGLAGSAKNEAALASAMKHESNAVRMASVLALRRLKSPQVAELLNDIDPLVVVEAARAIHDEPIEQALPQLAALINRPTTDDALIRRVLNANFRIGTPAAAAAVAAYAAQSEAPESLRIEALQMLGNWSKPSPRDRVLGMWRPLSDRPGDIAVVAMKQVLPGLFTGSQKVRAEAAKVATDLGIQEVGPALLALAQDGAMPGKVRGEALVALVALKDPKSEEAISAGLKESDSYVRAAARTALAKLKPAESLPSLEEAVLGGDKIERQQALATLAKFTQPGVNAIIAKALDKMLAGELPADTHLDLVEAAKQRAAGDIKNKLAKYEEARPKDDPVAGYQECLEGGDAENGRKIFFERAQVSCVRCHKVSGTGGDVGPELSKIAEQKQRPYLLESIVVPNKAIAKNFETAVLLDSDGRVHMGIVKFEDNERIDLMTAEAKLVTVKKDEVEERKEGKSAMPEDLTKHLNRSEVRDLVEFLSNLK